MARRFWVRVTILLLATTVAYLLFVTFFVSPRAAWFTVASQNGYVLQKVFYEKPQSTIWRWGDAEYSHEFASQVFSDAHIELLLRVPADMKPARGFAASVKSSRLQVRVVASDGRKLPCVWVLREDLETTPFWSLRVAWLRLTLWLQGLRNTGNVFPGGPRVAQLHIAVPCGYPPTVRWFEAYLRDPKGRSQIPGVQLACFTSPYHAAGEAGDAASCRRGDPLCACDPSSALVRSRSRCGLHNVLSVRHWRQNAGSARRWGASNLTG